MTSVAQFLAGAGAVAVALLVVAVLSRFAGDDTTTPVVAVVCGGVFLLGVYEVGRLLLG